GPSFRFGHSPQGQELRPRGCKREAGSSSEPPQISSRRIPTHESRVLLRDLLWRQAVLRETSLCEPGDCNLRVSRDQALGRREIPVVTALRYDELMSGIRIHCNGHVAISGACEIPPQMRC